MLPFAGGNHPAGLLFRSRFYRLLLILVGPTLWPSLGPLWATLGTLGDTCHPVGTALVAAVRPVITRKLASLSRALENRRCRLRILNYAIATR